MSTFPAVDVSQTLTSRAARLSPARAAALATVVGPLGFATIWPTLSYLWEVWTVDAMKSIGMVIPVVSLVLILRAWRSLGWELEGSWWGLVILAVTIAVVRLRDQAVFVFVFSPRWNVNLPPPSLVVFAYGAGVVLLFGGRRLLRAALFPVVLLWFVNPVPHIFNVLIDLPLQRIAAHVARDFAIALGQRLSPDQMRLMFTPDFGMFIAPGCNGIRGSVTMGFIALIAGYVYRFRWYAHAAVITGAVLLGYVFNLVRLCTLVIYYILALHIPWLRPRAEMGDYIIGACLFLIASLLLFYVIQRLGESPERAMPADAMVTASSTVNGSVRLRLAAMALLALFGCYGVAKAAVFDRGMDSQATNLSASSTGRFPRQIGSYALAREWDEREVTGALVYHWAEYAPAGGGMHISIGISSSRRSHDALICHSARGEDPLWRDQLNVTMANHANVSFSLALYNEATQYLEASTVCSRGVCGEYTDDRKHFGLVYSKPDPHALFLPDPQRPIPILLKAETVDTSMPLDLARRQLMDAMKSFLASADFDTLTQPYRRQ